MLFFVVAEVAPKTYAIQHTDRAALRVTPLLWFLTQFWPIRMLSRGLIGFANVILPGKGLKEGPFVTEEEIRTMADVAASEDAIEREERALIHSIFEFGDTVVREVMRPRPDMVTVDADDTIESAIAVAIERGFSRIPACGETTDDVIGLVYLKDLVRRARAGEGEQPVRIAVRPATFVPEQKRVAELLREMQTQQFHMAVVIDEYGDTVGVVTLEDLLEEIVGEIADEYDVEEPGIEHLADGSVRFPGRTPIDEVNEELHTELPDTEWDTDRRLRAEPVGSRARGGRDGAIPRLRVARRAGAGPPDRRGPRAPRRGRGRRPRRGGRRRRRRATVRRHRPS